MCEVEDAKGAFLARYNPLRIVDDALVKAINAAVQRNRLYGQTDAGAQYRRVAIRAVWGEKLRELAKRYEEPQDLDAHEDNLLLLRRMMNDAFGHCFTETGFRISHAQKSLSVLLKHLWCMNKIPEPPVCPIDRSILQLVGAGSNLPSWTKVDTIETYREHLSLVRSVASATGQSMAVWELCAF